MQAEWDDEVGDQHRQSWDTWGKEQLPKLLLFARQQVVSVQVAEDLVQEAVIECWRKQVCEGPPPLPLVYATIRRRAIDGYRAAARRQRREEATAIGALEWFVPDMGAGERVEQVQKALEKLSVEQREVVVMKVWGELTFEEISGVVGIPLFTAASRYRYAIESMKKELAGIV